MIYFAFTILLSLFFGKATQKKSNVVEIQHLLYCHNIIFVVDTMLLFHISRFLHIHITKKNYQQQQPVARRFFLLFFHFHRKEKAFFSSHSISFSDFDIFIHKYFTLFTHYKIIPHEISLLCVLIGFNF